MAHLLLLILVTFLTLSTVCIVFQVIHQKQGKFMKLLLYVTSLSAACAPCWRAVVYYTGNLCVINMTPKRGAPLSNCIYSPTKRTMPG